MKHSIIKKINLTEIARVTISLDDTCGNGSDDFGYQCELFSLNGNKGEAIVTFGGKIYRDIGGDNTKEFMLKHFAELEPIYILKGCDSKGLPVYPLMNGAYHLAHDINYAMEELRITKAEAKKLNDFKPLSLAKYLFNLTETRYKVEVDKAIKMLEELTCEKYKPTTNVSAHLFNDLHYVLITEAKGWNIHKGEKNKNKLTYHLDLSK